MNIFRRVNSHLLQHEYLLSLYKLPTHPMYRLRPGMSGEWVLFTEHRHLEVQLSIGSGANTRVVDYSDTSHHLALDGVGFL